MKNIWKNMVIGATLLAGCTSGQQAHDDGVIVSVEWLESQLGDPSLVVLQVGTREGFDTIHIPGARFLNPNDFMITSDSLRNQLPSVSTILENLTAEGIGRDSRVILCYEKEGMISRTARVFMTLDYVGLGDRTHVLNGGLISWMQHGLETTDQVTEVNESTMGESPSGVEKDVVIGVGDVNMARWDPEYLIVDSRSPEEYYGEIDSTGHVASGGHIEGSYSLDYHEMLSDTLPYTFKEDQDMLDAFKRIGMDRKKTALYYCGSGVRASVNYLVARHLGYPALVYDGSIEEWNRLDMPLTAPVIDSMNKDN